MWSLWRKYRRFHLVIWGKRLATLGGKVKLKSAEHLHSFCTCAGVWLEPLPLNYYTCCSGLVSWFNLVTLNGAFSFLFFWVRLFTWSGNQVTIPLDNVLSPGLVAP